MKLTATGKSTKSGRISFVMACSALALALVACSDDKKDNEEPCVGDNCGQQCTGDNCGEQPCTGDNCGGETDPFEFKDSVTKPLALSSKTGCRIDTDCSDGLFCFQGLCTKECDSAKACKTGTCNSRGRCVTGNGKKSLLRDRSIDDPVAMDVIADVSFVTTPASKVDVLVGQETATVETMTAKDYGPILYRVEMNGKIVADAAQAEAVKKDELYVYTFEIPTDKSALGDKGEIDAVTLMSSVGTFNVSLVPRPEVSGAYDGAVVASQFGGSSIPFRAAVEVTPKNPKNFSEITAVKMYLPVSTDDIFSPENAEAGKVRWVSVDMQKADKRNCRAQEHDCWEARFGTNNFAVEGSNIVTADAKLYRSVRVELSDYDAAASRFEGFVNDSFKGIYRDKGASDDSAKNWAEISVEGKMLMTRTVDEDWTKYGKSATEHKREMDISRDVEENVAPRCADTDFAKIFTGEECAVSSLEDFNKLTTEQKLNCTVAGVNAMFEAGNLTSDTVKEFLSSTDTTTLAEKTGCYNFVEFLTACANQTKCEKGTVKFCEERPEMVCAADLLASLYFDNFAALAALTVDDKPAVQVVFDDIAKLMRESYLGPQFAAYQLDINIRKQWLENTNAPRVASSVLEDFNTELLSKWKSQVLDAHKGVIAKQFNQGIIEVLARKSSDSSVKASLEGTLTEYADAWQGASEALALATRRYDSILSNAEDRADKAAEIRKELFDLYVVGAVESSINLSNNITSLNASYGVGINEVTSGVKSLDQSFEDLIYMRDAEIAVSTSLDPESNNDNLLKRRKAAAEKDLNTAKTLKETVFTRMADRQFNQASISALLSDNVDNLRTEMASLCGLPKGCKTADDNKCAVEVDTFKCGLVVDKENDDIPSLDDASANVGSAGAAVLAFREAQQDVKIAQADLNAQLTKVREAQSVAEQYAHTIESLNSERKQTLNQIKSNLNQLKSLLEASEQTQLAKLEQELALQYDYVEDAAGDLEDWDTIVSKNNNKRKSLITAIEAFNVSGLTADYLNNSISKLSEVALEYLDYSASDLGSGTAQSQGLASARGGIKAAEYATWFVTSSAKYMTDSLAVEAQSALDQLEIDGEYEVSKWERADDAADLARRYAIQESINDLQKKMVANSTQREILAVINEGLQKTFDAKAQYEYDRAELRELSQNVVNLLADVETKRAVVIKAEIARDKKLLEYLSIAQKAQLLKSQYDAASARLTKVSSIYATPACIFSDASDLETLEAEIDRAKEKLYDYLALVEYYAVRPFVDLRRAIYLAKSPNDLLGILNKIDDLVEKCGTTSQSNQPEITISLREFMGITRDYEEMTMPQRFRAVMSYGDLPVDALTRYTADSNVKKLISQGNLMAGTFQIDKNTFNIGANCNAKIKSFAVRVEGENLSNGNAVYPNVTIFYNGASTLTSCQPNMDDVVKPLGGRTRFGTYTSFSIPTEKMTPNASVGKYIQITDDTKFSAEDFREENHAFDGLPIMTSYTVLIDPTMGDNSKINWDNVEDIKLKIIYSYDNLKSTSCY